MTANPRIDYWPETFLDEFVAQGVDVHLEAMSDSTWWIGVRYPDGRMWHINIGVEDGKPYGFAEEDSE